MAKTTFKEGALRAVAILGLLAILLLGAWGIIQIAFFISDLVSHAGGAASNGQTTTQQHELITISVPSSATAGTPVTIGWNHQGGSGNYSYAVAYSCVSGLTFKAPVPTGATQSVACNTPFNYTQAKDSLAITPVYSGTTDAKVTITVTATNLATGAITAQSSGTLTVLATKAAPAKTTTSTTKTSSGSTRTSYVASAHRTTNLYGYSDLAVTITSAYSTNGNGTLQFVVQNVGTNVTPANWTFNVTLPGGYQYPAGPQQALYPGDKIVYSMGYSDYASTNTYGTCNQYGPCSVPGYQGGYQQPTYGYNPYGGCGTYSAYGYNCGSYYPGQGQQKQITVTVDPFNQIAEAFKGNNTATASYFAY